MADTHHSGSDHTEEAPEAQQRGGREARGGSAGQDGSDAGNDASPSASASQTRAGQGDHRRRRAPEGVHTTTTATTADADAVKHAPDRRGGAKRREELPLHDPPPYGAVETTGQGWDPAASPEVLVLTLLVGLLGALLWMQFRARRGCRDTTILSVSKAVRSAVEKQSVTTGGLKTATPTVQQLADGMHFLQTEYQQRLAHKPDVLQRIVEDEGGALPPKILTQELDFYTEFLLDGGMSTESLRERMSLKGFELLLHTALSQDGADSAGKGGTSYFVSFSPQRRLCILSLHDPMEWADFFDSVQSGTTPFLLYEPRALGHRYISKAAQRVASEVRSALLELLVPQGYSVTVVGHGVAGGIAAVLSVLLKEECGVGCVKACCVGPPPCLDRNSALGCKPYVTSVVNGSDVLPRASLAAVRSFAGILHGVAVSLAEAGPGKTRTHLPTILRDAQKVAGMGDDSASLYLPGAVVYLHKDFGASGTASATLVDGTLSHLRHFEVTPSLLSDSTHESHVLALRQLLSRMPPDDPSWHFCGASPQTRASSGSPRAVQRQLPIVD